MCPNEVDMNCFYLVTCFYSADVLVLASCQFPIQLWALAGEPLAVLLAEFPARVACVGICRLD